MNEGVSIGTRRLSEPVARAAMPRQSNRPTSLFRPSPWTVLFVMVTSHWTTRKRRKKPCCQQRINNRITLSQSALNAICEAASRGALVAHIRIHSSLGTTYFATTESTCPRLRLPSYPLASGISCKMCETWRSLAKVRQHACRVTRSTTKIARSTKAWRTWQSVHLAMCPMPTVSFAKTICGYETVYRTMRLVNTNKQTSERK